MRGVAVLALGIIACSRTPLDDVGASGRLGPTRHLVSGHTLGDCGVRVVETMRTSDSRPRSLEVEALPSCPDPASGWRIFATHRYAALVAHNPEGVHGSQILDTRTLAPVRAAPELYSWAGCAFSEVELALVGDESWALASLASGERTALPVPFLPDWFGPGCVSDGEWAYLCAPTGLSSAQIVPVRVADRQVGDADPDAPGNQPYQVPYSTGLQCNLTLDSERARLYVQVNDFSHSMGVAVIELDGSPEPRLVLSGERTLSDALSIALLPDGQLFVLVEAVGLHVTWEWLRLDPVSEEVVSLRSIDADWTDRPSPWAKLVAPGLGPWVMTLAPGPDHHERFVAEWFNGLTGEAGPRVAGEFRQGEAVVLLPDALDP